jgi:hypothetical protein
MPKSACYRILDAEVHHNLKPTETLAQGSLFPGLLPHHQQDHMECEWLQQLKDKDMSYLELLMQYQGTPYVMLDNIELSFL